MESVAMRNSPEPTMKDLGGSRGEQLTLDLGLPPAPAGTEIAAVVAEVSPGEVRGQLELDLSLHKTASPLPSPRHSVDAWGAVRAG